MKNLETEFVIEKERRYLAQNPQQASRLALGYLSDFLKLAQEVKKLEQKLKSVVADNQRLTSQLIEMSSPSRITLPSFLECHRH
ncbi:conserved hypothetical protein [Hyella patelloides LEGE 07179]|uniref:Uncharacterized protein n=1 Tax=Hyella patelloides LEGE 07179 TaxID=945734 RepID=A0A563VYK1_9CYAN|nr:hypothetical protein [Hyella patelloides]VEP16501.1 conserved hypothetical protein [Hyella patelloides LEGE 07179]